MTYLPTACAALVLVQAAFPAGAQSPPAGKPRIDELVDQILKRQDTMPTPSSKRPSTPAIEPPRGANTSDIAAAVREKIRPCWNPPAGSSAAVVVLRVEMNRDATPVRAEVLDKARYSTDANFRSAADSAYRTVMNPRCQPWPLSAEKYDSWRTLTFNFDPRDHQ